MEQALERQARATEQQFLYASEERPEPMILGCRPGAKTTYSIACDPLDGSSVLSSNFAVGALAGVWQGGSLLGVSPRSMAAAVAAVFGSRTTFFLALKSTPGVHEFVLEKSQTASYLCTHTLSKGVSPSKPFAPGNLRASRTHRPYADLVLDWARAQRTLRYSGAAVPDVCQLLVRGGGVFTNVTAPGEQPKLRSLFEVAPLAFLVERAGGESRTVPGQGSALDAVIWDVHQRSDLCVGSSADVALYDAMPEARREQNSTELPERI
ncbi:fructose-1-6-bisphosphatase [Helicosporidium sp. ATCC 50920]|nr:fructose-1-6-bisphosphatase [Helicosporidium sp. ATCC 50920]|eukprot:KDD74843.1 fructose-1-6-bisphosphatase [Helicosporidium sp. ATCC 50920]